MEKTLRWRRVRYQYLVQPSARGQKPTALGQDHNCAGSLEQASLTGRLSVHHRLETAIRKPRQTPPEYGEQRFQQYPLRYG